MRTDATTIDRKPVNNEAICAGYVRAAEQGREEFDRYVLATASATAPDFAQGRIRTFIGLINGDDMTVDIDEEGNSWARWEAFDED